MNYSAFAPAFTVPNSISLASALQNQQFPSDAILVSFDVSNMYANIPVAKTIGIMIDLVSENRVSVEAISEFKRLVSLCIGKNICT